MRVVLNSFPCCAYGFLCDPLSLDAPLSDQAVSCRLWCCGLSCLFLQALELARFWTLPCRGLSLLTRASPSRSLLNHLWQPHPCTWTIPAAARSSSLLASSGQLTVLLPSTLLSCWILWPSSRSPSDPIHAALSAATPSLGAETDHCGQLFTEILCFVCLWTLPLIALS